MSGKKRTAAGGESAAEPTKGAELPRAVADTTAAAADASSATNETVSASPPAETPNVPAEGQQPSLFDSVSDALPAPAPAQPQPPVPTENADGNTGTTPAPVVELPVVRSAASLKPGERLRCPSFHYMGATYDTQGVVIENEDGPLLEITALKALWPVRASRVSMYAAPKAGVVGTWQHVESDYPHEGKDAEFDKRFRVRRAEEEGSAKAESSWKPPRKARAGYAWVQTKTAIQGACYDVKGNLCKRVGAGQYVEVQTQVIADSRSVFKDV